MSNRLGPPPSQRRDIPTDIDWQERIRRATVMIVESLWDKRRGDPEALYEKTVGYVRVALSERTSKGMKSNHPDHDDVIVNGPGVFRIALSDHGWLHDSRGAESVMVIVQRTARETIDRLRPR